MSNQLDPASSARPTRIRRSQNPEGVWVWEAAWLLQIKESAVRHRIAAGHLPVVAHSHTFLVPFEAIEAHARSLEARRALRAYREGRVAAPRAQRPSDLPPPLSAGIETAGGRTSLTVNAR